MTEPGPIEFRVSEAQEGKRLDAVVGALEVIGSRAEAQRAIEEERVRVEGSVVRKRHLLSRGEIVQIIPVTREPIGLTPQAMDLPIAFEDEHLLVVDKPAGIVTHPSRGHAEGTLVHGLLDHGIAGGEEDLRPGVVHRLDRDTSGLLIVAKRPRAHRRLQAMLRDREIDRRYTVLVHGAFPPAMAVDRPIGRDRRNRTRQSVHSDRPREARTRFRRLEEFPRHSLLEARLDTGRTHQIRVHLESVNFPVVGDPVYGRPGATLGLDRQFLHAASLSFPHPETGEPIELVSPLPEDLQSVLDGLREG